jgi:SNF2 family DNA or RNA helicase
MKFQNYEFKTKPYEHQLDALRDSWAAEYYALFMEMGTGKSKVAIDTMGLLYKKGHIDAVLIVAPKGVYDNWVRKELEAHLPDDVARTIIRWTPSSAKAYQEELAQLVYEKCNGIKILVINVEAFSTPRGTRVAYEFCDKNPNNLVIVDESTTIKNRKAQRTANIVELLKKSKYRRILTGSPITKSPMDLFSQCAFLSPKALGISSYFAYQNRYAVVQKRTMGHKSFNEITGYRRLDELNAKLDKFSNRVLKSDCLDLPDKIYMRRDVQLTDEQAKAYNQMQKLALAKLQSGELSTTASVLTQIMRLQQICCGHLPDDSGDIHPLKSNRLNELLDVVEETSGTIVIWATYTHDLKAIQKALNAKYGESCSAIYYGGTAQDDRQEIVNQFQDPDSDLRFFIGQPRTGGYGITLTGANTMIYFNNGYDLEIRLQSEDRIHRIGQGANCTYIDLVTPNTIDEKILKALRDKIDIAGQVLGEDTKSWLI